MSVTVLDTGAGRLRPNQLRALEVFGAGGGVSLAATQAGVEPRTVRRWMRDDPKFRDELRRLRRVAMQEVATRAAADAGALYDQLRSLALEPHSNGPVRLAAIRDALRIASVSDLEDRLQRLEERLGVD